MKLSDRISKAVDIRKHIIDSDAALNEGFRLFGGEDEDGNSFIIISGKHNKVVELLKLTAKDRHYNQRGDQE